MSWRFEMDDNGNWISNGVRFATKEECDAFGSDLKCRWFGMPNPDTARSAQSDDPINYAWADGKLVNIETGVGIKPAASVQL